MKWNLKHAKEFTDRKISDIMQTDSATWWELLKGSVTKIQSMKRNELNKPIAANFNDSPVQMNSSVSTTYGQRK